MILVAKEALSTEPGQGFATMLQTGLRVFLFSLTLRIPQRI